MQILLEKIQEQMKQQTIAITEAVTKNVVQQIDERFKMIDDENKQLKNSVKELKEEIKGLEMAKKKTNILLFGIKENKQEELSLVKYISEKLNCHLGLSIQEHEIMNIYRIGKIKTTPRPILISLVSYWRKMEIMRSKNKLPQGIYVKEDYTKEILEARKTLQPKLEEERRKGNIAYLKLDKLIIKSQTDANREKRKRDPSSSPNVSTPRKENELYVAPKKVNTTNAYEYMARVKSNSLREKTNV